ncbi:hypothetical protein ACOSP7_018867 [Xanthoceras sorbifolium]
MRNNPISMPLFALVFIVFVIDKQSLMMPGMVEAKSNVHIVYLGERQHDDTKLIIDSHHQMLADIVGSKEEASKLMVYNYKHGFSGLQPSLLIVKHNSFLSCLELFESYRIEF